MRVNTYAWGFAASLCATVAWFAGCGGTVNQNTTGGTTGAGGHVTAQTVTSSTTTSSTSSTTTSSTSSSSTSGGNTPCDMACAHVASCGFGVTCAQFNINCATVGSQFDCAANCINALSCQQLISQGMACLNATCSDGGAGDAGPTDGGMMVSACTTCVGQSCLQQAAPCAQDATCQKWLGCAQACNNGSPPTASCFQACDAMYASASTLFNPVYTCTCTSCGTQCSASDPCAHGMDGGP